MPIRMNPPMSVPYDTPNGLPPMSMGPMPQQNISTDVFNHPAIQQAIQQFSADAGGDERTNQIIRNMQAIKNAGIFDSPKTGFMNTLSNALLAGGDALTGTNNYANKMNNEAKMRQQQMEFLQKYADKQGNDLTKSVFTIGDNGEIVPIGTVPKGSQVVPPASMQTPEQKSTMEAKTASLKDAATRATKLRELNKVVDYFENKIGEIPSGTGIGGRLKGIGLGVEGMLQTNPKVSAYNASIEGLRSQIARGLGEVGNLSEYEQRYASNLLPRITDNAETRANKIKNFRDYITTKLGNSTNNSLNGVQRFTVNGVDYDIPADKVDAFKKAKGL